MIRVILALVAVSSVAHASEMVLLKSPALPITAFSFVFRVGSADDPKGAEGLANLTAELLREGGVKAVNLAGVEMPARSRAELEEYLFPFAADVGVSVGKEQISVHATSTAEDAEAVFNVLAQLILAPAFDEHEFERLRAENLDAVQKQMPREDEEELGKAALDKRIYGESHPYSHLIPGTEKALRAFKLDKVQDFFRAHFTQKRLQFGVAGVVDPKLVARIESVFKKLPVGIEARVELPRPEAAQVRLLLVKGPFDAVGVHFGHAVSFHRGFAGSDKDFPNMYLAAMAFGKHRSFVGRLMRVVREIRGLNYGDYSYVEDFPFGGGMILEPNLESRRQQAFTVWGRPATLENGCFLLRQLYRETLKFASEGLSPSEFKLAKSHLIGFAPTLATGIERRLGYALDSSFYGIQGDYLLKLQSAARASTRNAVNAAIRRHIDPKKFRFVVVTPDPDRFKNEILGPRCDIHYAAGIKKNGEIIAEDQEIATRGLGLKADDIVTINSEDLFKE